MAEVVLDPPKETFGADARERASPRRDLETAASSLSKRLSVGSGAAVRAGEPMREVVALPSEDAPGDHSPVHAVAQPASPVQRPQARRVVRRSSENDKISAADRQVMNAILDADERFAKETIGAKQQLASRHLKQTLFFFAIATGLVIFQGIMASPPAGPSEFEWRSLFSHGAIVNGAVILGVRCFLLYTGALRRVDYLKAELQETQRALRNAILLGKAAVIECERRLSKKYDGHRPWWRFVRREHVEGVSTMVGHVSTAVGSVVAGKPEDRTK